MVKFYITTPIYYVNNKPHIGNAYTTIMADIIARHQRFLGNDVFFLAGTDEHGAKIEEAAKESRMAPQQFCDIKAGEFKDVWEKLEISYDYFIRTTDENHIQAVKSCLQYLYDKNFIYKGFYEGLYCRRCEQYKTKTDLKDGKCPDHQLEPEIMREETYFFKMSQFQNKLVDAIKKNKLEISPESKKREILSFLKSQPLEDISISRKNVKWGIPLPFDIEHTCYVWVDAFLNYLTGIGWEGPNQNSQHSNLNTQNSKLIFWPADIQLMAKDILRVHSTIWPSLLLALDIPLPKKIFAHGFFSLNGQKISKTLGNVIWPGELLLKYGADATRYLLATLVPFGNDGDISRDLIAEKYNSELVNGVGNAVSRFIGIVAKNPATNSLEINLSTATRWKKSSDCADIFNFALMAKSFSAAIDKKINDEKIWQKSETKKESLAYVAEHIFLIALYLKPFMPETSKKILESLGLECFNYKNWPEIEKEIKKQPVRKIIIKPLENQLFPRLK